MYVTLGEQLAAPLRDGFPGIDIEATRLNNSSEERPIREVARRVGTCVAELRDECSR